MKNAKYQLPVIGLVLCVLLGLCVVLTPIVVRAQTGLGTIIDDPAELEPGEVLRIDEGDIRVFQFSPDETNLAVATSVGLWIYEPNETGNGVLLDDTPTLALWWSADSTLLAGLSDEGFVHLWQMADRTQVGVIEGAATMLTTIVWAPDGSQIATGSADGVIEIWDVNEGVVLETLEGHTERITSLYWTSDGSQLISIAEDGSMRVWQVQVATPIQPTPSPTPLPMTEPISATVQVDRLNVRSGPGMDFERIGTALRGEVLPIFDEEGDCSWIQIQTPGGIEGWVAGTGQFVLLSSPCETVNQPVSIVEPDVSPTPTNTPGQVLPLPTPPPQTDVAEPTSTPAPASPTTEPVASEDPLPPDMGCYLFQNQLGPSLTVTITSNDGSFNQSFEVPEAGEVPYCLNPGAYTFTIDAPPPWADINGDLTVQAGERFFFPVRPQE